MRIKKRAGNHFPIGSARVSRPRRGPDRRSPFGAGTGDLRSAGCHGQETVPQQVLSSARVSRPRRGPDRRSPFGAGTGDLRSAGCHGQETVPQQVLSSARVSRPRRGPDRRSPFGAGTGDLRSAGCHGQETVPQPVLSSARVSRRVSVSTEFGNVRRIGAYRAAKPQESVVLSVASETKPRVLWLESTRETVSKTTEPPTFRASRPGLERMPARRPEGAFHRRGESDRGFGPDRS